MGLEICSTDVISAKNTSVSTNTNITTYSQDKSEPFKTVDFVKTDKAEKNTAIQKQNIKKEIDKISGQVDTLKSAIEKKKTSERELSCIGTCSNGEEKQKTEETTRPKSIIEKVKNCVEKYVEYAHLILEVIAVTRSLWLLI